MTDELSNKLDISKNVLIISCLALILGFLLVLSLIICVATDAIEIKGVKEIMGVLGGIFMSPSVIIVLRKLFSVPNKGGKKKS